MKTYATWEVIKSLTEKTQQKFKLVNGSKKLDYLGSIVSNYVGFLIVKNTNGVDIDLRDMSGIFLNGQWELVQEPVTFMEAINSKKKIKPEGWDNYRNLIELSKTFSCRDITIVRELINKKWFIEEDNINE